MFDLLTHANGPRASLSLASFKANDIHLNMYSVGSVSSPNMFLHHVEISVTFSECLFVGLKNTNDRINTVEFTC